ncbi:Alpha-mannosidase 2 [Orchesella cincta]|uniref:Alpha-mannosidase 2 n=1 Tax=Orchesella cincta TaxID=48709 RepID=A0A1D2NKX4_ORCCI|nr:Alpha-mannosidase 2 [Orchesella cincta]
MEYFFNSESSHVVHSPSTAMPMKIASLLLKPRNLRFIVLTLIAGTLVVAIYHMYYGGMPDTPLPTNPVPADNLVGEIDHNDIDIAPPPLIGDSDYGNGKQEDYKARVVHGNEHDSRPSGSSRDTHQRHQLARGFNYGPTSPASQPSGRSSGRDKCFKIEAFLPDFDASKVYPTLEFDASWITTREYWNADFEKRYQSIAKKDKELKKEKARPSHNLPQTPPLKVFVIPHSHNDPGWLKTFEGYFYAQTKEILDNAVEKLTEFKQMKFLWSEISFLSKWWEHAHPTKRAMLQQLVKEGRVEIVTGGWVMTDEATVNLYSMIDQLIEGQQWVKAHLGVVPKSSWSVDPFGHGSVFPYILQASSIKGMVIQRIHYGWKKWFLDQQKGDFKWVQRWDTNEKYGIKCHNAPWDIYSIKHSCGPFPQICLNFDFRNISGEYSENYLVSSPITPSNVKQKAELMLEQYGRTASMFTHNIAMISMGDDFRFHRSIEWDQQYNNYMKLFDHINANKQLYNNAEVQFGTVSDYFKAPRRDLSSYQGFFVYSDNFQRGLQPIWRWHYSTQPLLKKFYRERKKCLFGARNSLAHLLTLPFHQRGARINKVSNHRQPGNPKQETRILRVQIVELAIRTTDAAVLIGPFTPWSKQNLPHSTDTELKELRAALDRLPFVFQGPNVIKKVVLYNSLGRKRMHLTKIVVMTPDVEVVGPDGQSIISQLNPVLELTENNMIISGQVFEVVFFAELAPLSVSVFELRMAKPNGKANAIRSLVYCKQCTSPGPTFEINTIQTGDIQLNNERLQLLFDRNSGFLLKVTKLKDKTSANISMKFGGYASIDFRSGAYLLMPDTNTEQEIPFRYSANPVKVFIVSGPLYSELSVSHAPLLLSTRLMHTGGDLYEEAIFVQNQVDLGKHNGEIFIRFDTDISSTAKLNHPDYEGSDQPALYTDQSGFTFEKRVKIPKIRYEGNTYPVNTMAYLQEETPNLRFTFVTRCASMEVGRLECMIERRTIFDDSRGMGEGVTDNRPTVSNYVLYLEKLGGNTVVDNTDYQKSLPTLSAHHLSQELSYPSFMYVYNDDKYQPLSGSATSPSQPDVISMLNQELPCDVNLLNLRTITDSSLDYDLNLPSMNALLIAHRFGYLCTTGDCGGSSNTNPNPLSLFYPNTTFNGVQVSSIVQTDLTGVSSTQSYNNFHSHKNLSHLHQILGEPFELTSVLVAFSEIVK